MTGAIKKIDIRKTCPNFVSVCKILKLVLKAITLTLSSATNVLDLTMSKVVTPNILQMNNFELRFFIDFN